MVDSVRPDSTEILSRLTRGEAGALESLVPLVYEELRARAAGYLRQERRDHTLQPTALVHDVYLRLIDQSRVDWRGRTHFLCIAATEMRRVLVEHARSRKAAKRGGGWARVTLDAAAMPGGGTEVDFLDLDATLTRLAELDPRQAQVVELRFFGGLKVDDVAEQLGISPKTVEKDWRMARAWLHARLGERRPTGDTPQGESEASK